MKQNFVVTATQCCLRMIPYGFALCFAFCIPATASLLIGWWGGDWNCNIDGRPAQMRWKIVDDSETICNGDHCSSSARVRWKGSFSDNGAPWVSLTDPRQGNKGGLFFRHADGNKWYLSKPTGNRTTGWTTWNGKRYSLSCWR